MRLYFILSLICKTLMVWPGANNQLDYYTVPDIQKYYLDGSNIHIVLITPMLNSVKYLFSHLLYSKKKKKTPLQYTYDYILEKIVRRYNCTLLYRLYDVLYVIILLYLLSLSDYHGLYRDQITMCFNVIRLPCVLS
jgi:hypothetical protein